MLVWFLGEWKSFLSSYKIIWITEKSFTWKWNLLLPSDHLSNTLLRISAKMRSISAIINQPEFGWDMQGRGPTRRNMGPHWQDWLTWSTRSMRKEQNNSITRNIPQTVAMSLCDSWQQPLQWGMQIRSEGGRCTGRHLPCTHMSKNKLNGSPKSENITTFPPSSLVVCIR